MKKRAAIARAMALEPELIFLDEPSAGLDPVSAVELDELILTLNHGLGLTVVLVTHELPSIFKIATRCIMLDKESQEHHRPRRPARAPRRRATTRASTSSSIETAKKE